MSERQLLCYVEGCGNKWEAFCPDFDLAVEAQTMQEAQEKLECQIHLFLESVIEMPEKDKKRLLNRRMPLVARALLKARFFLYNFSKGGNKKIIGIREPIESSAAHA